MLFTRQVNNVMSNIRFEEALEVDFVLNMKTVCSQNFFIENLLQVPNFLFI